MRNLSIIILILFFYSCEQENKESRKKTENEISTASENACIQCTQKIQAQLASCIKKAGNDQKKIDECNAQAAKDWTNQCSALCKPGLTTSNSLEIEIGEIKQAEKTNKPADKNIKMVESIDGGVTIKEACSGNGHIRKVTVNGVCYLSMCCGGQWVYFYKDVAGKRIWCTCALGESWTVNCNGNNWIIGCF